MVFPQVTHFLMFVFLLVLLQDISAHESNILGSFCDMNVSILNPFCVCKGTLSPNATFIFFAKFNDLSLMPREAV